ncbi:tRNA (adenine(37)-N6)-methyltransferase [Araneus ventricosus]|uniref:tRNA (Adenine(37)-N6)-methyltransferase n=1 Tax=Araneus ventricosus TaxID=182803 RepID=A0A4Y2KS27_ARAVE|nr:tRNA (adenine(37)-N6)-methyltransferase [Araneus ventricosus]
MADIEKLATDVQLARRELKNIRQECMKQKVNLKSEVAKIKEFLSKNPPMEKDTYSCVKKEVDSRYCTTPIGFISSCFKTKNGIPRQPALCPAAKGTLTIEKSIFSNPEHSLIGLNEFSHIWILFVFHENGSRTAVKAKVHPPRLNGASVGVFSTRSPHRPCAIGLSLTKLDKIEGSTLFLSGIDLLDGTPVLDIKPYIPLYDMPSYLKETLNEKAVQEHNNGNNSILHQAGAENVIADAIVSSALPNVPSPCNSKNIDCNVASFLTEIPKYLDVLFTDRALRDLERFHAEGSHEGCCVNCFAFPNQNEAKEAITDVLKNDPRSVYRRTKCSDRLYYFFINSLHITCWFDESIAEVLRVKPCTDGNEKYDNL